MSLIDPQNLSSAFRAHFGLLPSAHLAASRATSFEGWFRIELAYTLLTLGFEEQDLRFKYEYPYSIAPRQKADLAIVKAVQIVFELKPFVNGADANKLKKFPTQIALLQQCVQSKIFNQGIAFATFFGYTDRRVHSMLSKFFSEAWQVVGPYPLLDGRPLKFIVAEIHSNGYYLSADSSA
jgi:hypothetical protein